MLRKPLFLEGVRLWRRPRRWTKSGGTRAMAGAGDPESPSTSSAARPLVRAESESASNRTAEGSPGSGKARTQT